MHDGGDYGFSMEPIAITDDQHRSLAIQTNGQAWSLIERVDQLGPDDRDQLLDAAHASAYHWRQAGTALHQLRAQWLLAKVNAELGNGQAALRHASRCAELTAAASDATDFDLAYAQEGLARAHAVAGDIERAQRFHAQATELMGAIANARDQEIALADLAGGNWAGFSPSSH